MNEFFEKAEPSSQWKRYGKTNDYMVQINKWVKQGLPDYGIDDEHIWNVYAFIYPKHPRFEELCQVENAWNCPLYFHAGANYMRKHYDENGAVLSIQFGNDFNHIHDYENRCTELREVPRVLENAQALYESLEHEPAIAIPQIEG